MGLGRTSILHEDFRLQVGLETEKG
jgi:hypothetical protein